LTPKVIDEESPLPPVKKSRKVVPKPARTEDEWQKLSSLKEKGFGWAYFLPFSPPASGLYHVNTSEIVKEFPGRSEGACKFHCYAHVKEKSEVFTREKVSLI
jgi:hypothetical protein